MWSRTPPFCACCGIPGQCAPFVADDPNATLSDAEAALARRTVYQRRARFSAAPVVHPDRTEFIVRRAYVVTTPPYHGDLATVDLHVRKGQIVDIGPDLQAIARHEIDGSKAIAVPGFVSAHCHLGTVAAAPNDDDHQILDLSAADEPDIYCAIRLMMLEAIAAGITSLNFCAFGIGSQHAETALIAQIDGGIRGRFSYPLSRPPEANHSRLEDLRRFERVWFASDGEHLLSLGIAVAGPTEATLAASTGLPSTSGHFDNPPHQSIRAERMLAPARAQEPDHRIGSLTVGKRADIILIKAAASGANPPPIHRAHEIVHAATAADVLLVAVDGRVHKENGVLTNPGAERIRREGKNAVERLRAAAQTTPGHPLNQGT